MLYSSVSSFIVVKRQQQMHFIHSYKDHLLVSVRCEVFVSHHRQNRHMLVLHHYAKPEKILCPQILPLRPTPPEQTTYRDKSTQPHKKMTDIHDN